MAEVTAKAIADINQGDLMISSPTGMGTASKWSADTHSYPSEWTDVAGIRIQYIPGLDYFVAMVYKNNHDTYKCYYSRGTLASDGEIVWEALNYIGLDGFNGQSPTNVSQLVVDKHNVLHMCHYRGASGKRGILTSIKLKPLGTPCDHKNTDIGYGQYNFYVNLLYVESRNELAVGSKEYRSGGGPAYFTLFELSDTEQSYPTQVTRLAGSSSSYNRRPSVAWSEKYGKYFFAGRNFENSRIWCSWINLDDAKAASFGKSVYMTSTSSAELLLIGDDVIFSGTSAYKVGYGDGSEAEVEYLGGAIKIANRAFSQMYYHADLGNNKYATFDYSSKGYVLTYSHVTGLKEDQGGFDLSKAVYGDITGDLDAKQALGTPEPLYVPSKDTLYYFGSTVATGYYVMRNALKKLKRLHPAGNTQVVGVSENGVSEGDDVTFNFGTGFVKQFVGESFDMFQRYELDLAGNWVPFGTVAHVNMQTPGKYVVQAVGVDKLMFTLDEA